MLQHDRRRPVASSFLRARADISLPAERLLTLSDEMGLPRDRLSLLLSNLLIWRYSPGEEPRFGLIDLRDGSLNAVRTQIRPEPTLRSLLQDTLAAHNSTEAPECLVLVASGSSEPFEQALELYGEELMQSETVFWVEDHQDNLTFCCDYDLELFQAETMDGIMKSLKLLVQGAVAGESLGQIRWVTESQRQVLDSWRNAPRDYPSDEDLVSLFQEQVGAGPTSIAATCGDDHLTYRELERRSDVLAASVRKLGVTPGGAVAFCLPRGLDVPVVMLGILKTGAHYLPLDPADPKKRMAGILKDSGATHFLTRGAFPHSFPAPRHVRLEDIDWCQDTKPEPARTPTPDALAYLMYTSGTTGKPKGVCIEHRAVVRLVKHTNYVQFNRETVMAQFGSLAFDGSTFEIWGPLLNGGRVVFSPEQRFSLRKIGNLIKKHHINVAFVTPALLPQLTELDRQSLTSLKHLYSGGEAHTVSHVLKFQKAFPHIRLVNGYGPTEGTVFSTFHPLDNLDPALTVVPIGRPISNTAVRVLDCHGLECPIGVPGELYLEGDGLARGYLHEKKLNQEKFPVISGKKSYRTGDRVRWSIEGHLEFLGRLDSQIKLRGHRIELEEVRTVLLQDSNLRDAAVVCRGEGEEKKLMAYLCGEGTAESVKARLQTTLPQYMIPSAIVFLESLPLNKNGKLDPARLPAPKSPPPKRPPTTELEKTLADIWCEVLQQPTVDVHHDFFYDLGGESLSATRVANRIKATLRPDFCQTALFEHSTVAELARHLKGS